MTTMSGLHLEQLKSERDNAWERIKELRADNERLTARERTLENTARINLKVATDRGADNERLRAAIAYMNDHADSPTIIRREARRALETKP